MGVSLYDEHVPIATPTQGTKIIPNNGWSSTTNSTSYPIKQNLSHNNV